MLPNQVNKTINKEDILLEINNLQTYFQTESGIVKAVNNINFNLKRGETLGIVGESGSGKSVTALSIMQLIPNPPGKVVGGEILFNSPTHGKIDIVQADEKEMRYIRGNEISMIFQEPMTSLNPVYTCGDQVMEAFIVHEKVSREEARKSTIEIFKKV